MIRIPTHLRPTLLLLGAALAVACGEPAQGPAAKADPAAGSPGAGGAASGAVSGGVGPAGQGSAEPLQPLPAPGGVAVLGERARASGPLRVLWSLPGGEVKGRLVGAVGFDRPMVPLQALDDDASAPWLGFEPPLPVRARWIDTRTLRFAATGDLPRGTRWTLRVSGARALDGSRQAGEHTATFRTSPLRIVQTLPRGGRRDVARRPLVALRFDQQVREAEVQRALRVSGPGRWRARVPSAAGLRRAAKDAGERSLFGATRAADYQRLVGRVVLVQNTGAELPHGARVRVTLARGLRGVEGPLGLERPYRLSFTTHERLRVTRSGCAGSCAPDGWRPVSVGFSTRVADAKPIRWLLSPPAPKGRLACGGGSCRFGARFVPDTAYTLTLVSGVADVHGQRLTEPVSVRFRTGHLGRRLEIATEGRVMERSEAPWQLAVRHRNQSGLRLRLTALPPRALVAWLTRPKGQTSPRAAPTVDRLLGDGPPDTLKTTIVDLAKELGASRPGVVFAEISADRPPKRANGWHPPAPRATRLVQITDLHVHARRWGEGALFWVTSLSRGRPVAGARVRAIHRDKGELWRGTTDTQGLARMPTGSDVSLLVEHEGEVAVMGLGWRSRVRGWASPAERLRHTLITDKGLYTPGDTAHIKGVVRRLGNAGLSLPGEGAVAVRLRDPSGKETRLPDVRMGALGTFHADVPLPATGPYGTWTASFRFGKGAGATTLRQSLRVAVYRPARFTVGLSLAATQVVQGETLEAAVSGRWLSGSAMVRAPVRLDAMSEGGTYRPSGWRGWSFGQAARERSAEVGLRHEAAGQLDAAGVWRPRFTGRSGHSDPVRVLVEAEVQDPSGAAGTAHARAWLHPAAVNVGLRLARTYAVAGEALTVGVAAVDRLGVEQRGAPAIARLFKRTWSRVRVRRHGDTWEWETVTRDTEVARCEVPKGPLRGRSCRFVPSDAGTWVVKAEARDGQGRVSRASRELWVSGSGAVAWHPAPERSPLLTLSSPSAAVGESVAALVRNPWPGAVGLLTIDRGGVREARVVPLPDATARLSIPVTKAMSPSAHVSLAVMRGRTRPGVGARLDEGGPQLRVASAPLGVDPEPHRLAIQVRGDKSHYRPGEEAQVALAVRDARGQPRAAELTVLVVDEGVLRLTGHGLPDPIASLYAPQAHGVADHALIGQLVRRRVAEAKGGPGGGGGGEGGAVRGDLRDVAWYAPAVKTDAEGRALVRFNLPDNLTAFRVMAFAVSGPADFGVGRGTLRVGKPLMVQLRPPRLAERGDRFEVSASVRNASARARQVRVDLSVTGAEATGPLSRQVQVPAGQAREVRFAVRANQPGTVSLTAQARAGALRDGVSRKLQVVDRAPVDVVAVHHAGSADVIEAIRRPKGSPGDIGGVRVQVATTELGAVSAGVESLVDYPFGCAEQTASRLLAAVEALSLKRSLGLFPERDAAALTRVVSAAIARLQTLRAGYPRGLFRLWPSGRSRADPALSAWVLTVLAHARRAGHAVPEGLLEEGVVGLRRALARKGGTPGEVAMRRTAIAAALSRLGKPDSGALSDLWARRAQLPWLARTQLAEALLHSGAPGDRERATRLLTSLASGLRVEGGYATLPEDAGAHAGAWGAGARASGMLLALLSEALPDHDLTRRLSRGLIRAQRRGHWGSTQANAWALLGLGAWHRAHQAPAGPRGVDFAVFVGGKRLGEGRFTKPDAAGRRFSLDQAAIPEGALTSVQVRRRGEGHLHVGLRYAVVDPIGAKAARNAGFVVQRKVLDLEGRPLTGALKRGQVAVVNVTVWSGEARRQVAVRAPLPGGLEVVDFQLAQRSRRLEARLAEAGLAGTGPWSHREVTPQEVRFFVDHLPAGQHTWRYVVRAGTRGDWAWPGASAEEMYDPEVRGRSAASRVAVGG